MAIDDILSALEEQADAETERIRGEALAQAERVETEARQKAARMTAARIAMAERAANREAEAEMSSARRRERHAAMLDEHGAAARAFELARARLAGIRHASDYEAVFTSLVLEALDGVEGVCELHVAPEDVELAERVVARMPWRGVKPDTRGPGETPQPEPLSVSISSDPSLTVLGGVVVEVAGGRIRRINTLESRIEKLRRVALSEVVRLLRG